MTHACRITLLVGIIAVAMSCTGFAQQSEQTQPRTPQTQIDQIQRSQVQVQQDVAKLLAAQAQARTSQVQVDQIQRSVAQLQQDVEKLRSGSWIKDYVPLIATIITAIVAIISLRSNLSMALRTLKEKGREEERKVIREKIDQFFGPFILLREKSKSLYDDLFLARRGSDETREFAGPDGRYRTVLALVRGYQFNAADKALLEQITAIGQETATLVQTKMGLVDDEQLRGVLSKATVHFWVMQQLMQGKFIKDEQFGRFVFPRELDDQVKARLAKLNNRLAELQDYT
jgi:hypothetical protein